MGAGNPRPILGGQGEPDNPTGEGRMKASNYRADLSLLPSLPIFLCLSFCKEIFQPALMTLRLKAKGQDPLTCAPGFKYLQEEGIKTSAWILQAVSHLHTFPSRLFFFFSENRLVHWAVHQLMKL